jgi:hypothetical protein
VDIIELFNPKPFAVNISGWLLTDDLRNESKFKIPDGTQIPAEGYFTFNENDIEIFALDSYGEEIFLIANDSNEQRLGYLNGFNFGDSAAGVSIGRHVTSDGKIRYEPMSNQTFGSENAGPVSGPLVITELMYHPKDDNVEFIEIKNIGSVPVDLLGTEISGIDYRFDAPESNLVAGGILLVVKDDPANFRNNYNVPEEVKIYGPFLGSLDNGGERIRIRITEPSTINDEPDLKVSIDIAEYSDRDPWPISADGFGDSLHRKYPIRYAGDPRNWKAAAPSPGIIKDEEFDWRELFFNPEEIANDSLSGPFADADKDGVVNILEYLLGSHPRKFNSRIFESFSRAESADGNGSFNLKFKRLENTLDYKIIIETSTDLENWTSSDDQLSLKEESDNGDGTLTLTYSISGSVDSKKVFFRLRVVELL